MSATQPAPQSGRLLAFAMLALVMLLWSGNMIVGRAVRDDIPPFTLALVRWIGALCIILPFALRQLAADAGELRRHWRPVLALGLIGVAGFNAFIYSGLRETTASNALLLQAAIPALVLLADRLFFGTGAGAGRIAGVTLSTLGVIAIVCEGRPERLLSLHVGRGDLLVLCGVIAWAVYTSLLRLRPACHPLSFLAVTFAIAALVMLPLAATEWQAIRTIAWRPEIFAAFAYVAVLPSVVAYGLYNSAVTRIGAAGAGQAITLMPLFGALLAAGLLDESLHGYHLTGMVLILAGIILTACYRSPR